MRLLVVNGDDFGLSEGVNDGIIEAHLTGILTSTSLMVLRPAARHAAHLAAAAPALSVGLHFDHDEGIELHDPTEAEHALRDQLDRFRDLTGRDPTHVDSHHHVHAAHSRLGRFQRVIEPLGVPLRHDGNVRYIGDFWAQTESGTTDLERIGRPFLLHLIDTQALDGFTELACHPARLTGDFRSSYLDEREVELQTLTEPRLREEIEGRGVRLVNYRDWPG
jgi:predicted glycoside hydrolase/deacetylase ChbG (UPF0249 family)